MRPAPDEAFVEGATPLVRESPAAAPRRAMAASATAIHLGLPGPFAESGPNLNRSLRDYATAIRAGKGNLGWNRSGTVEREPEAVGDELGHRAAADRQARPEGAVREPRDHVLGPQEVRVPAEQVGGRHVREEKIRARRVAGVTAPG